MAYTEAIFFDRINANSICDPDLPDANFIFGYSNDKD